MYEEESDSEPEVYESEYVTQETEEEIEKTKIGKNQPPQKNIYIYFQILK